MSVDYQLSLLETTEKDFEIKMQENDISYEVLDDALEQITHWLKSLPHLCNIVIERGTMKRYLFGKCFDIAHAKMKIENMYVHRAIMPEIFNNRNANNPDILKILNTLNICVLPKKLPDNSRVSIISLNNKDPEAWDSVAIVKVTTMFGDLRCKYDTNSADYYFIDCNGMTLTHFLKFAPYSNKMMFLLQKCYGSRVKGYHLINFPDIALQFISKLKSLMKKKMADRIYMHKDVEEIQKIVPKRCLPVDYGGLEISCRDLTLKWLEVFKSPEITKWFSGQEKYKSDEKLRSKNDSRDFEYSGVHGTFRTLNID